LKLSIPELSLVVLIGPSGSGKSTFAKKHFLASEVLSSDFCRFLVSDDENNQAATNDAFEVLHYIAAKRLAAAKLAVVDATNVQREARKPLVDLARQYHVLPVAIVLNLPEGVCADRNRDRADRNFGPHVVRNQSQELRRSLKGLERRVSATSTFSTRRRRLMRRSLNGSRCGTTASSITAPSTSSAMFMVVSLK
jgi:protein phosphatase